MKLRNLFKFSSSLKRRPTNARTQNFHEVNKRFFSEDAKHIIKNWRGEFALCDDITQRYHTQCVRQSRSEYRTNDHIRKYIKLIQTNIIGHNGIELHAMMHDKKGERLRDENAKIEKAWQDWCQATNCDSSCALDFIRMQHLILKTVAIDGEALIKINYESNSPYHFSLQLIDTDRLDIHYRADLKNGHFIRFGIELNQKGKVIAYHLKSVEAGIISTKNDYIRVPASEIIHVFEYDQIGQKRGFPWVATALLRAQMLEKFFNASICNAVESASKIKWFQQRFNTDGDDINEFEISKKGVSYGVVPNGFELIDSTSQYPTGELAPFSKEILKSISSSLGVSYNSLASDLEGVNYSSLRHGAIEERDGYRLKQEWFIASFLKPVYAKWLEHVALAGVLQGIDKEQARDVIFQPRRWQWVDPTKEIGALEKKLELGLMSRSAMIRELGEDPETVFNELKNERDILKSLGLSDLLESKEKEEKKNDEELAEKLSDTKQSD